MITLTSVGNKIKTLSAVVLLSVYATAQAHMVTLFNFVQDSQIHATTISTAGNMLPAGLMPPTRIGYVFGGYFASNYGQGTQYYSDVMAPLSTWDANGDGTIYAHWYIPGTSIVVFNNGSNASGGQTAHLLAELGELLPSLDTPTPPTLAHHQFSGYWDTPSVSGTQYYLPSMTGVTGKLWDKSADFAELFARWTYNPTAAIYLDTGPGTNAGTNYIHNAATGQYLSTAGLSVPALPGYSFEGYFAQPGGQGVQYISKGLSTAGMSPWDQSGAGLSIYAHWVSRPFVNVTFSVNYPGNPTPVPSEQSKQVTLLATYGALPSIVNLPANSYLIGWFTTGTYENGTRVIGSSAVINSADHTLYALIVPNTDTVTVTLNAAANGGAIGNQPTITRIFPKTGNYTIGLLTLPAPNNRPGWQFNGWYTLQNGGTLVNNTTPVPGADSTYYAQWSPIPFSGGFVDFDPVTANYLGAYDPGATADIPLGEGTLPVGVQATYQVSSGTLPLGLLVDPWTGSVYGAVSPDAPLGFYSFSVTLSAGYGAADVTRPFTLAIGETRTVTLDPWHLYNVAGICGTTNVPAIAGVLLPSGATAPTHPNGAVFAGFFALPDGYGTQFYAADMTPLAPWHPEPNSPDRIFAYWLPAGTAVSTIIFNNGIESQLSWTKLPVACYAPMPPIDALMTPPTRPGYVFDGYWDTPAYGGPWENWWPENGIKYYNADLSPEPYQYWNISYDGTYILYARWKTPHTHNNVLCLDHNDGSGNAQYMHGNTIFVGKPLPTWHTGADAPLTLPQRQGYVFAGFFENADGSGAQYISADLSSYGMAVWDKILGYPPTSIYAHWESAPTVSVTFVNNSGYGTAPVPSGITATVGAPYGSLPAVQGNNEFIGWFTTPDFQPGTHVTEYTVVTDISAHTLYALVVQGNNQISAITFDPNGGSLNDSIFPVTVNYPYGIKGLLNRTYAVLGLPVPDYRPGYVFDGWYDINDNLAAETHIVPQNGDTLTAHWSPVPISGGEWSGFDDNQVSFNDLGTVYRGQTVNIPIGGADAGGAKIEYVTECGIWYYGPSILPWSLYVDPETGEIFGQVALDEALGDYYFVVTLIAENEMNVETKTFKLTVADEPLPYEELTITAFRITDAAPAAGKLIELEVEGCLIPLRQYAVFGHHEEISLRFDDGASLNAEILPAGRQYGVDDGVGQLLFVFPMPVYDTFFFHVRGLD